LSTEALPIWRTTYNFNSVYPPDGDYALVKSTNVYDWNIDNDYTTSDKSTGRFMLVNADYQPKIFYTQTLNNLCAGTTLVFSAMVANVHFVESYLKPNLQFELSNTDNNEIIATYNTGDVPSATITSDWRLYGFTFEVPANVTSILLNIQNNQNGGSGNDLGLDDIQIRLCTPPVNIVPSYVNVVLGNSQILSINFTNDGTFIEPLEYQWFYSPNGTTWTSIANTESVLKISNASSADTGFYRVMVSGAGSIASEKCRAMSMPAQVNVIPRIEIPMFFSPNEDGKNDFWKIKGIEYYKHKVYLYDRFSKLLFEWDNNFPIEGWNGMYLGKPMPSTDYWYLIVLEGERDIVGHFTLLR
jgi:gliding motility-associated-like protein